MNVLMQRHCAKYIYIVPNGLRELLSDISREVLRSQPEDIYTFIADYLDALLITRENARVSAQFVQHMSDAAEIIVNLLDRTGMSREEADATVTKIQECFRSWREKKGILKEDDEAITKKIIAECEIDAQTAASAASIIQNAFKEFQMRQQLQSNILYGTIDWRVAGRSAIQLYRKTGVSPEEAKRAAGLIKAAYKGYYTRKTLQSIDKAKKEEEKLQLSEESFKIKSRSLSGVSTDKKSKVRIDFSTVIPRVNFDDEKNLKVILEETQDDHEDVKDVSVASETSIERTEKFIKKLMEMQILNPIDQMGEEKEETQLEWGNTSKPSETSLEAAEKFVKKLIESQILSPINQTSKSGHLSFPIED